MELLTFQQADVLGNYRQILAPSYQNTPFTFDPDRGKTWWNCPFCSTGLYEGEACANPWCIANPQVSQQAAWEVLTKAAQREKEAQERERNHKWAMDRVQESQDIKRQIYAEHKARANKEGFCFTCWRKRRKEVRHRKACPYN